MRGGGVQVAQIGVTRILRFEASQGGVQVPRKLARRSKGSPFYAKDDIFVFALGADMHRPCLRQ